MPAVASRALSAIETVGGTTFKPCQNVKAFNVGWQNAKRVFAHNGTSWVQVWNNRPTTTTGDGSSSAYDRITVTGTVDPNNFSTTPRFYYKKDSENTFTAGGELTSLTGDTVQSVGSVTITGLVENTVYNYFLSATSEAGTSDNLTIKNVTTPLDCRTVANGGTGWSSSAVVTQNDPCGTCGGRSKTVTTYTKTGCVNSPYSVTTYGTCTEVTCGCATASTNGWSALNTRYRNIVCGTNCGLQSQKQTYITKSGCTETVVTDWTNDGTCADESGYDDVSGDQVDGGTFAGVKLHTGTYGFMGPDAIYTYTNVQCGLGGPCCGGNGIKYYRAEQCSYNSGAQRWVLLGCYAPY